MKFIEVTPENNYILRVKTDDANVYLFDVYQEVLRISSYRCLMNKEFFEQVKFKSERIYWCLDCDFHIDQMLALSKQYDWLISISGHDSLKIEPLK